MKIRTITAGFILKYPLKESAFMKIAEPVLYARDYFTKKGYEVQTVRFSTQPWEDYEANGEQIMETVMLLEEFSKKNMIDYFSTGTTKHAENIPKIYGILKLSTLGFCTSTICNDLVINYEAAEKTAGLIKKLSVLTPDGFSNLRFAAIFNVKHGSPFFPASYHKGKNSFSIGTENSDLINKAFEKARSVKKADFFLSNLMSKEYLEIEKYAEKISKKTGVKYSGIDVSIASSVNKDESLAYGFEKLGTGKFGEPGTLTIAKIITEVLKNLPVKKCGYSGLMLPLLEDHGLATRNNQGLFDLNDLLLYSSVCGTGLDTIPLPGDVSEQKLYALLLDLASLSIKLGKPLSARLMPIPGKKAKEMTEFNFEYFVNSKIMKI